MIRLIEPVYEGTPTDYCKDQAVFDEGAVPFTVQHSKLLSDIHYLIIAPLIGCSSCSRVHALNKLV